jgi:hypothetical protein
VYVGSRDRERGQRAVGEIGTDARLLVLDVTDGSSIAAAAGRVQDLDILVSNADIMVDGKPATEADADSFRRTYETNVFGVVAVTNAFLPALRRSAHPRIVNVSQRHRIAGMEHGAESAVRLPDRGNRRRLPVVEGRAERADGVLRAGAGRGTLQGQCSVLSWLGAETKLGADTSVVIGRLVTPLEAL